MTEAERKDIERPEGFPKAGSAEEGHLQALLENASPEQVETLQALFTDGLSKVLEQRAKKAYAIIDHSEDAPPSTHEGGQFSGLSEAERLSTNYGEYLGKLVSKTVIV